MVVAGHVFIEGADFGPPPVMLPAAQVKGILRHGDMLVDHLRRGGPAAGIVFTEQGCIDLRVAGAFWVHRSKNSEVGGSATIRSAQYICGILGLIILYAIFLFDRTSSNVRDFALNFASDIFAVSMVLIVGEFVDNRRETGRAALEEARYTSGVNIYDQPFASAGV